MIGGGEHQDLILCGGDDTVEVRGIDVGIQPGEQLGGSAGGEINAVEIGPVRGQQGIAAAGKIV